MKELLQQKAEAANGYGVYAKGSEKYNAFNDGYIEGAKEILDNPELYGLVTKDKYDEDNAMHNFLHSEYLILEKENKELKEKVTELEGVIAQQRTEPRSE